MRQQQRWEKVKDATVKRSVTAAADQCVVFGSFIRSDKHCDQERLLLPNNTLPVFHGVWQCTEHRLLLQVRSHSRLSSDQWQQENKGCTANDELWLLLEYCDKGSVQVGTLSVTPFSRECKPDVHPQLHPAE